MATLRNMMHDAARLYRALFSIAEIERQPILQWMFGATLFYFFVNFFVWIQANHVTAQSASEGRAICWPFFEQCGAFYFLDTLPYGYTQPAVYMIWYGVMALIVYYMWQLRWVRAHLLLSVLFLWKLFIIAVSFASAGPYDYYHITLTAVLLGATHKEYFLKLSFVFMYFMSATIKFSPGWVLGTYFSSLEAGLPFIPRPLIIVATNIVIFGQIVEAWFLLSKNRILQRIALWYATLFHLYSGVLVSYTFPSIAVPPILILFGPLYRYTPAPFTKRSLVGWAIVAFVGVCQLLGFVVTPDRFMTLEGHRYGMYMFDANHQCRYVTEAHVGVQQQTSEWNGMNCSGMWCLTEQSARHEGGGTVYRRVGESSESWHRCDPYEVYTVARASCGTPGIERIALTFDHSINGGPFYRIVDEPDICSRTYRAFSHNEWIKVPPEAPVIGYPLQNVYHY